MKHILYGLLTVCTLTACSKMPDNGPLAGEWILQDIFSKTSASQAHYTEWSDKRANPVFWNIHSKLISINTPGVMHNGKTDNTMCRFAYEADKLCITHCYVHFRNRDSLLTNPDTHILEGVGIRGNAACYKVEALTSSRLVLCSPLDSLNFRKKH